MGHELRSRLSAVTAANLVFGIVVREFWPLLRVLLLPSSATAVVLYLSLKAYLLKLIAFIPSGNPQTASLALGALAAGVFLSMFLAAVAISSVTDLVLLKRRNPRWFNFNIRRQEWRLYAAYLRFLLVAAGFLTAIYVLSALVLPALTTSAATVGIVSASLTIGGCYWLFARLGFLIAPIVARSSGTVLRKAVHQGSGDFGRNLALVVLLSFPGLVIEIAGEHLFRLGSGPTRVEITLPLIYYARALEHRLMEFVFLSSLSAFLTLVLFTTGAIVCYRDRIFSDSPAPVSSRPVATLDSAPV